MVRTRFAVDVGCITKDAIDAHWPEFFQHDITGAEVILRGKPPFEFGGTNRERGRTSRSTQEGFSSIYSTVMDVKSGGTVRVRPRQRGRRAHVRTRTQCDVLSNIHRPVLSEGSCLAEINAGGAVYRNRQVPERNDVKSRSTPTASTTLTGTWGSCISVENVPSQSSSSQPSKETGDNVYGIEEQKAMEEIWKQYKGHFSIVSAGVENTWGLDTVTETTRVDEKRRFKPIQRRKLEVTSRTRMPEAAGAIEDFDAGYDDVMGVTADDKVWQRPVSGANQLDCRGPLRK